jgi:hypothetical protein
MARGLVVLGLVLAALGSLWPWLAKMGLGRLPGDLVIERENVRSYAPLATSLLVSVVVSLALRWSNR